LCTYIHIDLNDFYIHIDVIAGFMFILM